MPSRKPVDTPYNCIAESKSSWCTAINQREEMVNHDVKIRFRHSSGDMGPFFFAPGCKVKDLKERLYQEWPTGEVMPVTRCVSPSGAQTATLAHHQNVQTRSPSSLADAFLTRLRRLQVGVGRVVPALCTPVAHRPAQAFWRHQTHHDHYHACTRTQCRHSQTTWCAMCGHLVCLQQRTFAGRPEAKAPKACCSVQ